METSCYEHDNMARSLIVNREKIDDLKESIFSNSKESMTHSTSTILSSASKDSNINMENEDTIPVELFSNVPINEDDLDIIVMFLENSKRSGGGNIIEFKLKENNRILSVKFEENLVRERILNRKTLKFKNYIFSIRLPFEKKEYPLDTKTIILRNFRENIDLDIVELYAESLVCNDNEENEVVSVEQSKMFSVKTFFVKFKFDFEMEKVEKNLLRKSTVHGNRIELFRAYLTNTLIIRMEDRRENPNLELVELHFTNKKRSGISSYEYLNEKEPFVILTLDSNQSIEKCLEIKHEISRKPLLVEYLHNFKLIDEDLNALIENENNQEEMDTTTTCTKLEQPISMPSSSVYHKNEPTKLVSFQAPEQAPSVVYDLSKEKNACILKYWNEHQLKRLTSELFDINAALNKISNEHQMKIDCTCIDVLKQAHSKEEYNKKVDEWTKKVNENLMSFFAEFLTVQISFNEHIHSKIKYEPLRISVRKLNETEYEIAGFKDQVNSLVKMIDTEKEMFQNEIINRDKTGLKLYECRILFVEKFIKIMKEKHEDLVIKINAKLGTIKMTGTRRQIEEAEEKAHGILRKIISRNIQKSALFLRFVSEKETAVANW